MSAPPTLAALAEVYVTDGLDISIPSCQPPHEYEAPDQSLLELKAIPYSRTSRLSASACNKTNTM